MDSLSKFLSCFSEKKGGKFWKAVTKGSLIPLENIPNKKNTLEEIYKEIISGNYLPSKPRGYLLINKGLSSPENIELILFPF